MKEELCRNNSRIISSRSTSLVGTMMLRLNSSMSWNWDNCWRICKQILGIIEYVSYIRDDKVKIQCFEVFFKVAHSITSLQKKGIKFEWTPTCEESFQWLENILTSAQIFKIANPKKDFVVCTDACNQGLGGVLMQYNHVICYELRKLKEHEKNYATHYLELAAIVHALNMWRNYLIGRKFELRTHHCGLKCFLD